MASVQLVAVTDVRGVGPYQMAGTGTSRANKALAEARQAARGAGVAVSAELRHHADPRHALLEAARGSDLLVLGGHVHSRGEGMFLGSAAVYALHAAALPVLIARPVPSGRPSRGACSWQPQERKETGVPRRSRRRSPHGPAAR